MSNTFTYAIVLIKLSFIINTRYIVRFNEYDISKFHILIPMVWSTVSLISLTSFNFSSTVDSFMKMNLVTMMKNLVMQNTNYREDEPNNHCNMYCSQDFIEIINRYKTNGCDRINEPPIIFMISLSNFIEATWVFSRSIRLSILYKMGYFLLK